MATFDEQIQIAVEGGSIAGTFIVPATRVPGVLFVHGWGGSQEQYLLRAREIAQLGAVCLTFDLSGHAATRPQYATVSRESNLRDLLAAYDMLAARRHVDPQSIAVVGSSYGGYLASILTTLRPVNWLALRAPALYIDTGWEIPKLQLHKEQDLETYRHSLVPAAENRALRAAQAFEGDVLLVQSEFDTIVPREVLSSYREACTHAKSLTYRCIAGAEHGLTSEADQSAYTALLVNWLTEMVFTKPASAASVGRAAATQDALLDGPPETA